MTDTKLKKIIGLQEAICDATISRDPDSHVNMAIYGKISKFKDERGNDAHYLVVVAETPFMLSSMVSSEFNIKSLIDRALLNEVSRKDSAIQSNQIVDSGSSDLFMIIDQDLIGVARGRLRGASQNDISEMASKIEADINEKQLGYDVLPVLLTREIIGYSNNIGADDDLVAEESDSLAMG